MEIKKFVEEFMNIDDEKKEEFVAGHIVDNYVSYLQKVERCKTLVKVTTEMVTDIDGKEKKFYSNNSANRHLLYMLELINNYTDIEVNMTDPANCYDELTKCKAIYLLHELMPKAEIAEWQMILNMELEDAYDNYRTIPSWLDTKFGAVGLFVDTFKDAIGNIDVNELMKNPDVLEVFSEFVKSGVSD